VSEPGEVDSAREALECLLLDGPRKYTRLQIAEKAGMPPERTQRLWRALGFPDATDDDPAFTDADVTALDVLSTLIDSGFGGPENELLADALARTAGDDPRSVTAEDVVEAAKELLPRLREVQDYVWRRHLAANADRMLATGHGDRRELAVGFADLVGYTSRSRGMGGRELGRMV
jgi:adenylate cyclase